MADDKRQEPGSITQTADSQNERISGISNVSNTITQMQKTTQRQIEETDESIKYGQTPETSAKEMNGVLSRFGKTITAFTKGIEDISISTARATKDAIGQYGKAIGQDISYNKQNVIAMALARTTPLFGYFAAKFMETDVFQKAKERMKESMANTFKGIGSSIANIFKGKEEAHKDAIPKMQRGGYVEKGGMVEVHPAEVIMPIEKILQRIDDSISVGREMAVITQKTQMRSLAKMSRFVEAERDKEPVGMVKGFLRAMREVQTQYEEPQNIRLLRAVLSIQDTLGATIGTWEQVWTKMLVEHPTFRQIAFGMKTVGNMLGAPFRIVGQLFKRRGGYISHLSRSKNPFENMSTNLGLLYTGTMWRLDNIALYTKAQAIMTRDLAFHISQGRLRYPKIESIGEGTRSIFGWARFGLHNMLKWGPRVIAGGLDIMFGGTGKGGAFPMAKKFGDWITREIEWGEKGKSFLKSQRTKSREFALEGPGTFGELIKQQQRKKVPPLITIDAGKAQEEVVDLLEGIDYHSEATANELDKHNDRERRKGLMGFFGMVGSGAMSILTMAGGFLKNALGLGKGGWLTTAITGLFAKGGPILGALTSPNFLGPLGAALGGYAVGTWFNKEIIEPYITNPWFKKIDELNVDAHQRSGEMMSGLIKAARGETATGAETYYAKAAAGAGTGVKRQETLIGTSLDSVAIAQAQREYIKTHRAEYANYDQEEIQQARERWRHSLGYTAFYRWKSQGGDPKAWGSKKEAAFLKYLKKVGTRQDITAAIEKHEDEIMRNKNLVGKAGYMMRKHGPEAKEWLAERGKYAINKAGQLVEKTTGKVIEAKDLAKMQASELLTTGRLLSQELKNRGVEGLKGMEGLGEKLQQNLSQVTNVINQQTSQVTRVFNAGAEKAGALIDEMNQRVVTGNFH